MRELEIDLEPLGLEDVAATVDAIAAVQRPDGCIPWVPAGEADPWDHVECAMALDVGGRHDDAVAAYEWLASKQRRDGAWPSRFVDGRPTDPTLDANFACYVATGCRHHWMATRDDGFLEWMWPVVESAVEFALDLQLPEGAIAWARDRRGAPWPAPLLTSSSCIHLSLRCAIAIAATLGLDRPEWELAAARLGRAISRSGDGFEPKDRYSMDWYYPVLSGALSAAESRQRLASSWDRFVVSGLGARCVSDRPWITTAETCELVLALDAVGLDDQARDVFSWIQYLRDDDGAYWTGATFPDGTRWPVEKSTWSSAVVVLAADALSRSSTTSGFFRGDGLTDAFGASERVADAS